MALYRTLGTLELDCEDLIAAHTPHFTNQNKIKLFNKARAKKESSLTGNVVVTRCTPNTKEIDRTAFTKKDVKIKQNPAFFNYEKDLNTPERNVWWMNYADPKLFGFYADDFFAQDEIQVLEHPILASVRRYLLDPGEENMAPKTLIQQGMDLIATPYLIENVPLWITVNTFPKLSDGTSVNIYGRCFAQAPLEAIDAGCKVFEGDVKDNIMAIAAPSFEKGEYSYGDIELILKTLISAFSQAKDLAPEKKCVVHGGNWGCGAFGGNLELMYFAQMYAASVCGIDELILHAVDDDDAYDEAEWKYKYLDEEMSLDSVVNYLMKQGYEWGKSDGN